MARRRYDEAERQATVFQLAAADIPYTQAKARMPKGVPFIRKGDYLALRREYGHTVKKRALPREKYLARKVALPKSKGVVLDDIGILRDAPRIVTEAPQIRQGMGGISRLRSEKYRRYYYADIRFLTRVFTKKRGGVVRYTTVLVGTFTPTEFRAYFRSGGVKGRIEAELTHLTYDDVLPAYRIEGFWVSVKAKEPV